MRALLLAAAAAAALVAGACTSGPPAPVDPQAYVEQIAAARALKDKTFREEPEPIPRDKVDVFLPLRYYPPDPSYAAPAELKLTNELITTEESFMKQLTKEDITQILT